MTDLSICLAIIASKNLQESSAIQNNSIPCSQWSWQLLLVIPYVWYYKATTIFSNIQIYSYLWFVKLTSSHYDSLSFLDLTSIRCILFRWLPICLNILLCCFHPLLPDPTSWQSNRILSIRLSMEIRPAHSLRISTRKTYLAVDKGWREYILRNIPLTIKGMSFLYRQPPP